MTDRDRCWLTTGSDSISASITLRENMQLSAKCTGAFTGQKVLKKKK